MSDNVHQGHRQRMRAKLYTHGDRIFDTYELLEMLLYYVIPYKDTNPISKRLLERFGSLDGVLSARKNELAEIDGIGERAAGLISAVGELGGSSPTGEMLEHAAVSVAMGNGTDAAKNAADFITTDVDKDGI